MDLRVAISLLYRRSSGGYMAGDEHTFSELIRTLEKIRDSEGATYKVVKGILVEVQGGKE